LTMLAVLAQRKKCSSCDANFRRASLGSRAKLQRHHVADNCNILRPMYCTFHTRIIQLSCMWMQVKVISSNIYAKYAERYQNRGKPERLAIHPAR
jgi:hypothetical protein